MFSGKTDLKGNVTNAGDVKFTDETKVEGTLSGAGSYTNSGTMTVADASKLQMTNGLENASTLNLGNSTNSVLGTNITGNGTTVIAGNVSNANGKTITQNALNITGTLTTDLEKLNVTNNINNNGIFIINSGTLAKNIAGTGTVKLNGTMNVFENKSIEGTLDGNGKILNMTNNATGSPINFLMVGTLKGNIDLQLDVDLNSLTSDMIIANAVDSGAKINVKSINITADNPAGLASDANLTFMKEIGTTPTHGTYTVNSPTGSITMTNSHTYKFEIGGNGILQCSEIGGSISTFKGFFEGTNTSTADTFSLTADYNYTDTGTAYMGAETQTHDTLNINLNGHTLNKTSSVMTVNTGAKTLNVNGGNTQGSTDLNFNVAAGGKLNICGKTNLRGNIAGNGTTEFNGETAIADGVHLGTATNNVSGTLDVAGNITASNINFKSGSTLKVDGTKIQYVAAISNITSASVESGSKLYVANAEKDREYKILKGSNLDVRSWTTEETVTGINASYGLKIDSVVNNGSEFNIKFTNDIQRINNSDIGNIIADLHGGSEVKEWVDAVSACQSDADVQNNTINTMANANQLANVQTGALTVSNLAMDTAFEHMSVFSNPVSHSATRIDFRNLANDNKKYKIDTISVGKIKDIQPTQGKTENENEQFTAEYVVHGHRTLQTRHAGGGHSSSFDDENKNVWATYIHSKQEIKDMKAGHLKQDSTVKQNGAAVGVDLWQSEHGFGGLSVTYAKGDVNSIQKVSTIKNEVDHYGANIYHRQDSGKFSVQLDAGCGKSENDIKMQTLGAEDVTLKPKTEAYSAGIKIEEQLEVSSKTNLVPFIGVRYTHMKTKETQSNIDITYGANEQDMCSIPVGLSLRHIMPFSDGFKIGTTLEGGYIFNVGDRKGTQKLLYGDVTDTISYNLVDRGQYFLKGAIQAIGDNMAMELGYHYTKSDKVKDNKWYVNANFEY